VTDAEAIVRMRRVVDEATAIATEMRGTQLAGHLRIMVAVCESWIEDLEVGEKIQQESKVSA